MLICSVCDWVKRSNTLRFISETFCLYKLCTHAHDSVTRSIFQSNIKYAVLCFQVCVVGDFTESEVESCLLDYLGTVTPANDEQLQCIEEEKPVVINASSTPELRSQQVCIQQEAIVDRVEHVL